MIDDSCHLPRFMGTDVDYDTIDKGDAGDAMLLISRISGVTKKDKYAMHSIVYITLLPPTWHRTRQNR